MVHGDRCSVSSAICNHRQSIQATPARNEPCIFEFKTRILFNKLKLNNGSGHMLEGSGHMLEVMSTRIVPNSLNSMRIVIPQVIPTRYSHLPYMVTGHMGPTPGGNIVAVETCWKQFHPEYYPTASIRWELSFPTHSDMIMHSCYLSCL